MTANSPLPARLIDLPQTLSGLVVARLAFRVPPLRQPEFEREYEARGAALLAATGMRPLQEASRETAGGFVTRLFAVASAAVLNAGRDALAANETWRELLQEWGARFGDAGPDGMLRHRLELYSAPAGPGTRTPVRESGIWHTYDGTDGLGSGFIQCIIQDRDGVFWFASYGGGVSRFDGQTIRNYTTREGLAHNEVSAAMQARDGALWFGTEGGASRFDGHHFSNFSSAQGLLHDEVNDLFEDGDGNIWFCTEGGVARYDGSDISTLSVTDGLCNNQVSCGLQSRDGHLWFGTEGGVSRYNGQFFTTLTVREGLGDNWCRSLLEDREGRIWMGTQDGGVSCYDGGTIATLTRKEGLPHDGVLAIHQDQRGDFWFGTFRGVVRYDGDRFDVLTEKDGLASSRVWSIIQDREGQFWFGTLSGVNRYDGETLLSYRPLDDDVEAGVLAVTSDRNGHLWLAPWGNGITRFDGVGFTTYTVADNFPDDTAFCAIEAADGRLWFGTWDSGVVCYDGNSLTCFTETDGLANNRVWTLLQDSRGDIWMATAPSAAGPHGGATRYDGSRFHEVTPEHGLAHERVREIIEDAEGNVWFATFAGLTRYDGSEFRSYATADGLVSESTWCLADDRAGRLWIGTSGSGLSRFDGNSFQSFTTADGLVSDNIWSALEDRAGCMWFGTNGGGVSRYDGRVFQSFTTADGLAGNLGQCLFEDETGDIWIGTNNGLTRYRPPAAFPPPVSIDAIVAGRRYEDCCHVEAAASVGLFSFEFHGVSFKTRPDALVFRYRLKGYDDDWRTTRARRVEYEGIAVGEYEFEVVAIDRDLVYSQVPATAALQVLPDTRDERIDELEQRVRERTRDLEEKQGQLIQSGKMAALGNLVAGIAHEINNPIGAMNSATDIIARALDKMGNALSKENADALRLLKMIAVNNDNSIAAGNRITEVVRSLKNFARLDEAEYQEADLTEGLESTLTLLRSDLGTRLKVDRQYAEIPRVLCYPGELNQVFMNLLTNAIEHVEGDGTITVATSVDERFVNVRIGDTGVGIAEVHLERIFDPGFTTQGVGVGTGLGLSISYNIVKKHGGRIDVASEVGRGTSFTVRIPLAPDRWSRLSR